MRYFARIACVITALRHETILNKIYFVLTILLQNAVLVFVMKHLRLGFEVVYLMSCMTRRYKLRHPSVSSDK